MTDYTNVTYNSYLEYASEYYGLLHDKICQENRLSNMINSKLILTENSTFEQKTKKLTALYEAKLGDKIKVTWQKFVDFVSNIFAKFMESITNILASYKTYLEKYKDIILNKASRIDPISTDGHYNIGVDRCVKVVIPQFEYNDTFKKALTSDNDEEALKLIIKDAFKYDKGKTMAENLKEYFTGMDKGKFNGKFDDLNRRDIYNFCYNTTNIKTVCDKDLNRLKSSTNAIQALLTKELPAEAQNEAYNILSEADGAQTTKTLGGGRTQQTTTPQNNDGKPKRATPPKNTATGTTTQNNEDNQKNMSGGVSVTNSNPVQNSVDGKDPDEAKYGAQNKAAKDAGETQKTIETMINKWIEVCRTVITAKCTAQEKIANGYMSLIRAHVRSYVGTKDNVNDNKNAPEATNYGKNGNTNQNNDNAQK